MKEPTPMQLVGQHLALIVILSICLTSCAALPADLQREVDRVFQEKTEQLIESLKRSLSAAMQEYREELTTQLEQAWEDSTQKAKQFLGLEAPTDVGAVSIGITTATSRTVIEETFREAYMRAGGGRVIGWPEGVVQYWDRSSSELLVQHFLGGSEGRSAIVMRDGEKEAYLLSGEWLKVYEGLGGPSLAGYPTSDPETWNVNPVWQIWLNWGRGRCQRFSLSSGEYALMRPGGLEAVYVVPPDVWQDYEGDAARRIGYPLSSYPLDESRWRRQSGIPAATREILNRWEEQPFRVQVYENGSLVWLRGGDERELIEYDRGADYINLGKVKLLLGVRNELKTVLDDPAPDGQLGSCFRSTIRHGANMAADASGDVLIPQLALFPLRTALAGVDMTVGSVLGKLAVIAAEVFVDLAGGEKLEDAVLWTVAGQVIDSIYAKSVGDVASVPMKETTLIMLEEEVARLSRGRIAEESSIRAGEPYGWFLADMDAQLNVEYDPLTHILTGVIVSDCAPEGILFFYRADPKVGDTADATEVWDGQVHFIDLATGKPPR